MLEHVVWTCVCDSDVHLLIIYVLNFYFDQVPPAELRAHDGIHGRYPHAFTELTQMQGQTSKSNQKNKWKMFWVLINAVMERRGWAGALQRERTLVRMVERGPLLEGDIQTEYEDTKDLSLEGEGKVFREAVIAHAQACWAIQGKD